jgi:hypothetical protein
VSWRWCGRQLSGCRCRRPWGNLRHGAPPGPVTQNVDLSVNYNNSTLGVDPAEQRRQDGISAGSGDREGRRNTPAVDREAAPCPGRVHPAHRRTAPSIMPFRRETPPTLDAHPHRIARWPPRWGDITPGDQSARPQPTGRPTSQAAGEIDAYDVDEAIHHYHRAARELWKFCWSGGGGTHTEIIAHVLDRMATDAESINWWDRVAPLQRD